MRYWTRTSLVQVMACRLFGAKPLPEPMLTYYQLHPYWNKLQWNINRNSNNFIVENAYQNLVCKLSAILCHPQCVITVSLITRVCSHHKRFMWRANCPRDPCELDLILPTVIWCTSMCELYGSLICSRNPPNAHPNDFCVDAMKNHGH